MKKLFSICLMTLLVMPIFAQNDKGSADDAARIAISPYVDPSLNFSKEVSKQLKNKMTAILTKQGLGGEAGQRFIMSANIDVLSEDIVVTTKEMYQYELGVNFIIGDGFEGTQFAMTTVNSTGLGETKAAAYIAALKKISPTNAAFKPFIAKAKDRIIEYYNSKCDFIIADAQALAKTQNYEGAIFRLMCVPDVCKDCYLKCTAAVEPIFQDYVDMVGAQLLAQAKAVWSAGLDYDAAQKAADILGMINPQSRAYPEAIELSNTIATRIRDIDQREWDFVLKQQQDDVDLQKAAIKAARDIGVAYGENQQPTYNIVTWW
ncbi:MAG: hypothetical protein J5612_05905 [Paludibacteraceae bacterium]|nr:hypothetical protein [Paludibacteraceae bacterium]